jgi:TRAP-type C4-dicarboxylate transport system substrate-binding protein
MTRPIIGIAFAAAMVALPAMAQDTLRAQTTLPTQHTLSQSFIKHFVEPLNAAGGPLQINLLGGPEVNPQDRAGQALERGLLDVLWIPAAFMTGQFPEGQAMMLQNIGIEALHEGGAMEHFRNLYREKANAHFLAWSETGGGYYLYLTKEPPRDANGVIDLTGLSIRSTGAYRPIIEALNGTPVQIPAGDVPQALERGVIDGFGWPTVGLESIGLADSVSYRVEPPFYHLANVVLVNANRWERMTDEQRELLTRIAREYEIASVAEMHEQALADVAAGDRAGITAVRMEGEAAERYLSIASEAMWENVSRNLDAETTEVLRALIYRSN